MHFLSKTIVVCSIVITAQSALAIDCGSWWAGATCRPGLGGSPSDSIWNPLIGDQQVVRADAANYAIASYMSVIGSILFGSFSDHNVLADYGPGTGSVSSSSQGMYKRVDVFDKECDCFKSVLQRIQ